MLAKLSRKCWFGPPHNSAFDRRLQQPASGLPATRRTGPSWRCDMTLAINDTAPDFEAQTTEGKIRFHDWIGNSWAVLFSHPEGLHAGVHHRARLHGQDQAGVRQARRQDHRPVGRSGRPARRLGRRHRGDPGLRAELPDDRRHRLQRVEALRHAAGRASRAIPPSARPPTTRRCATCSSSARTRRSS